MRDPDLPDPPPVKHALGAAKFESVNSPADGAGPPSVDVHAMLRDNLEHEKSAGLHELKPQPARRTRRRRDYWRLLCAGNLLFGLVAVSVGPGAAMPFVCAIGGMGIFTAALTWIMWFVMDDY
jgi:hypothetical protein